MVDFSQNYFTLFDLPVGFAIDADRLALRYRAVQKVVHPDRFAAAGEQSQRLSLQRATLVNEAYQTLREPLARARYLLELKTGEALNPQASLNDPEFLMRQMALRETLAGIAGADDARDRLDHLMREIAGLIEAEIELIDQQFASTEPQALRDAAQSVQRLQFLYKLRSEADTLAADLDEDD